MRRTTGERAASSGGRVEADIRRSNDAERFQIARPTTREDKRLDTQRPDRPAAGTNLFRTER